MNRELSTITVITNASSCQAQVEKSSALQNSDCNCNESGTKRKRGRPRSQIGKKPWALPVSKAFYEKMRRRGELIMDALGYGAAWMKCLMPHLDAYMLKGEKLGYHYEYECMRIVFTCLCLDIDTAMQRSACAKARAAERRAAAEMAKAKNDIEKSEEDKTDEEAIEKTAEKALEKHDEADKATEISTHPDETTQPLTEAENNQAEPATESKPTEQATDSPTPKTSIPGPISDAYNPDDADKLSLHHIKRFFRKNALKIKRTQVRRV